MSQAVSRHAVRSVILGDPLATSVQSSSQAAGEGLHDGLQEDFGIVGHVGEGIAEVSFDPANLTDLNFGDSQCDGVEKKLGSKLDKERTLGVALDSKTCCCELAPDYSVINIPAERKSGQWCVG